MKKTIILFLFGIFILAGCGKLISSEDGWLCADGVWVKHGNPSALQPTEPCATKPANGSDDTPEAKATDKITPEAQADAPKSEIGGAVTKTGTKKPVQERQETEGDFESLPGVIEGNIVVDSPQPNETVGFPLKVYGKARVFESQFNWRLLDSSKREIDKGSAMTNGSDAGKYGAFQFVIETLKRPSAELTLEVFDYSAKDGSKQDLVSIPLKVGIPLETGLKAYRIHFATEKGNEGMLDCGKTQWVERSVPATNAPAKTALGLLFQGPTKLETTQGIQPFWIGQSEADRLIGVSVRGKVAFLNWQGIDLAIPNASTSCGSQSFFMPIEKTLLELAGIEKVIHALDGDPSAFYGWMQMVCPGTGFECDKANFPGNRIAEETGMTQVKLFFANDRLDPDVTCEQVFSVDRTIPKTKSVAMAALVELLKGTNAADEERGFRTTINPGVTINRLTIVDGVAKVDFSETLQAKVGGSCWTHFIRLQIAETLKQFPSVQTVEISINGRTEDILQP
jgi:hypothetical protein